VKEKRIELVKAKNLCLSSILPPRSHTSEISESVESVGIQQPLIVRPIVSEPGKYELIDGKGRASALGPEDEVYVDVRENVSNSEVFKISEATFKRTPRSTYETAAFYAAYVDAVKLEVGENAAQARVAAESQISESQLSQYLHIYDLFKKLFGLGSPSQFCKLERMGINKLYELAKLKEHPRLLEVAGNIEENADSITVEAIHEIVETLQPTTMDRLFTTEGETTTPTMPVLFNPAKANPADINHRFKKVSTRLATMLKKLDTTLSQISLQSDPPVEMIPLETVTTLEKISKTLRRLSHCLVKLQAPPPNQDAPSETDTKSHLPTMQDAVDAVEVQERSEE
jgi:ParB/RepB/Spo0J family partition protein